MGINGANFIELPRIAQQIYLTNLRKSFSGARFAINEIRGKHKFLSKKGFQRDSKTFSSFFFKSTRLVFERTKIAITPQSHLI